MKPLQDAGGHLVGHVWGGAVHAGDAAEASPVLDPSTGAVLGTAPVASAADLDAAFGAAAAAFPGWRDTPAGERARALLRLADALEDAAERFVAVECANTGKPVEQMRTGEIPHIADVLRFSAGAARVPDGTAGGEFAPGHTSAVRREPVGVVAQITPWNYPLMMATWKWAPALAAGNAVVLKTAETTPLTPALFAELAAQYLPPGVLNTVCGGRAVGRAMVAHPVPAMVAITGSVAAGRDVMATAAAGVKRLHLELGGKAPVVVFDDADLPTTVAGIIGAALYNAGQSCTAATRVLATPGIHDALVAALATAASAAVVGPPDTPGAVLGPLNNPDQRSRVAGLVDRRPPGAELVCGGAVPDGPGFFYPPTVLAGLDSAAELSRTEVFGPVLTVQRVADEDDAWRTANATEYGLAASIWTTDAGRAARAARALDFGAVWVNCHSVLATEMPHGGYRSSGFGSDLSAYSVRDYTRLKHVVTRLG